MMRMKMIAVSFLAVLMLFSGSVAYSNEPSEAATLKALITMFDSSRCRECHEKIYNQWETSHHARPLMGLNDQIFMASYLRHGPIAIKPGEKGTLDAARFQSER